jgi:hypothetical protein
MWFYTYHVSRCAKEGAYSYEKRREKERIEKDKVNKLSELVGIQEKRLALEKERARSPEEKDGLIKVTCARYKCDAVIWKRKYQLAVHPAYENHWCDVCSVFVKDARRYLDDIIQDDESRSNAHFLFLSRVTREFVQHPREEREYYMKNKE